MPSTLELLDENIKMAFRTAFRAVVKASTGAVTTIATTADGYTRTAGSFVTDGFDVGDEVVASGCPLAVNNGMGWVTYVDDITLQVMRPDGVVMVVGAAGAAVTITAGMPSLHILESRRTSTDVGKPWTREHYQAGVVVVASMRAPTARVRQRGVFWLNLFYPSDVGTSGVDRLRGKILASIYPAMDLRYNGQVVRVQQVPKKDFVQEASWVGAPIAWHFQADTINPA